MEAKRALFMKAVELLLARDEGSPSQRAKPTEEEVMACFEGMPRSLPEAGVGREAALDSVAKIALLGSARLDHPGFFAHMDPQTCDEAVAASILMVGLNNNMLHPDVGPSARRLEATVIEWLAPFFGMGGGHMVFETTQLSDQRPTQKQTNKKKVVCLSGSNLDHPY